MFTAEEFFKDCLFYDGHPVYIKEEQSMKYDDYIKAVETDIRYTVAYDIFGKGYPIKREAGRLIRIRIT